MPEEKEKVNWFLWLIEASCLAVIIGAFYFFYYKQDYDFIVEVPCDISKETCFQRDCSEPDSCPPNELSDFKRYAISAGDFQVCENENCANVCENKIIKCEPLECTEDIIMGESCASPESSENNE